MEKRIESKSIAIAAVTIALTVAIAPYPFVFMLPMVFTCSTRGMKMSLFMGLAFGVTSLMYALFGSASLLAVAFVAQPWIPIVPRVFVAFFARGSFVLARRLIKPDTRAKFVVPYAICGAVGALSNTALVVSCLVLFAKDISFGDTTILLFVPVMLTYGVIELVFYTIVVPLVAIPVEIAVNNKRLPPRKVKHQDGQSI